jgi:hypothetical protein
MRLPMKSLAPLLSITVAVLLSACAGSNSTIRDGYAYRMSRDSAKDVVQGALAANVPNDRIDTASDLTASGSIRHLADKHTFYVSAIPLPAKDAFGFEVSHSGTLFTGPSTASKIYRSLLQRADAAGPRVSVK